MEIKKPSESPPKLLKTNNSIALRTSFQALLYCHVDMKKNRTYDFTIVDEKTGKNVLSRCPMFAQEIEENKETFWLDDLRWYRSKHDVGQPPRSSIL